MQDDNNDIHLIDYLKIIIDRRYVVLLFCATTLAVVLYGTMTVTPLYKATTSLVVEKNELNKIVSSSANRFFYDDEDKFLLTQEQIITSHDVAKRVLAQLNRFVDETPALRWVARASDNGQGQTAPDVYVIEDDAEPVSNDMPEEGINMVEGRDYSDDALRQFVQIVSKLTPQDISSTITTTTENDRNTVYIGYISRSPLLAAVAANRVADAYVAQNLEIGSETAKISREWMDRKIDSALEKLEASERKLQDYMKQNDILTVENRFAILPQKLAQLSARLTTAQAEREEREAIYQTLMALPEDLADADTIPAIAEDRPLQEIQEEIVKAEQDVMRLSNKYGPKHPVMIRASNNLEVLREKKKQIIEKLIKYEKNNYFLAKSKEENLRNLFLKTKEDVVALNDKIVGYDIVKKDVESNRELYESLIGKVKEQHLLEDVPPVTIRVIEKAVVPLNHFSPKKKRNIMLALIVGIFGGIGLAFFLDYLDQTVKTRHDMAKRFGIPVLAMIPVHHDKTVDIDDVVLNEPLSIIAEAFKSIRMFIFFSARKTSANTILVTSSAEGDGKTTTAVNLAMAIAQSNARVLLIDADLRDPRIHNVLNLDNSRGLSTLIGGAGGYGGKSIQEGPLDNMYVITSGPLPENPSELIGSTTMGVFLKKVESRFDYIIFDSPVCSVTDSLILARYADGTILVTRFGKTTYPILGDALTSLKNVSANVFGIVINGAPS